MADTKLSALTELSVTADDDEMYVRDVSENTDRDFKRITLETLKTALRE